MKKLKLNLEALEVEKFEPEASASEQPGSVHGHSGELPTYDPRDVSCVYSDGGCNDGFCSPVCYTAAYDCTATVDC